MMITIALSSTAMLVHAADSQQWLTINSKLLPVAQSQHARLFSEVPAAETESSVSIIQIDKSKLRQFTNAVQQQRGRCGGFIVHDSLEDALADANMPVTTSNFKPPEITHQFMIDILNAQLDNAHIIDMIKQQTSHKNRYYQSKYGVDASDELRDTWADLVKDLPYASVKQISNSFPQKTVELTLKGSKYPDQVIVLGAHLDSIAGLPLFHKYSQAPGADDDASGIASETEIIRILAYSRTQLERTVKFYGYAAEEGGLRGSKKITQLAASNGENVLSAVQFDMTNVKRSNEDVVFMTDYTDINLTHFLEKLMDTYTPDLIYSEDKCGYACSDHVNWTKIGVPAAMPFESELRDLNPNIHSRRDTLENSDVTGMTALNFSKLGMAYIIESGLF